MTDITIRQEYKNDFGAVHRVIEEAFRTAPYSDQDEHYLVQRLRLSDAFIPELSLVAEKEGKIVGHILLTRIKIKDSSNIYESLALAPVSVLPAFQGKGIGGSLIREAHDIARNLGHTSIVLLGDEAYYPRFGYTQASAYGIELPFEVPKENCMVIELVTNSLKGKQGMVQYPKEFMV